MKSEKTATLRQALSWTLPTLVLASATLLLTNCSKTADTSQPGTFTSVYNQVLNQSTCVSCHSAGGAGPQAGTSLDFTSKDSAYNTLTTKYASGLAAGNACGSVRIIAAGNPQNSYFMGTLFSDYRRNNFAGATGCMPADHTQTVNLTADEKSSITQWIQNGAQNN